MDALATFLAFFGGFLIVLAVLSLVFMILYCVCMWKIFVKMGAPGWKGIIPFYNNYVMAEMAWSPLFGFIYLGLAIGGFILGSIDVTILVILGTLFNVAAGILGIIILYKVTVGLGKPGWWIILAIFVPFVYFPLMAFSS